MEIKILLKRNKSVANALKKITTFGWNHLQSLLKYAGNSIILNTHQITYPTEGWGIH